MSNEDITPIKISPSHRGSVLYLAFSHSGLYLASSSTDCIVQIYGMTTREMVHKLDGHRDFVRSIA
jgi:WD40 repeat protein